MLLFARSSFQSLIIRGIHNLTFQKRLLVPNKIVFTAVMEVRSCHFPSNTAALGLMQGGGYDGYTILRTKSIPCTGARLASTADTENPARSRVDDEQPTGETISDFHLVKLRSWAFTVEPFGCVSLDTSLSVRVTPTNPHDYPAADRAFVHLLLHTRNPWKPGDELDRMLKESDADSLLERYVQCSVQYQDGVIHVTGDAVEKVGDSGMTNEEADQNDYLWLVEIPMSYDVNAVTTNEASVTIEQLENQSCDVQTDKGDIVTKKLKSDAVSLRSTSGDVNCLKMLQGNISIATGDSGTVTSDRLQGQDISVSAGSGSVLVKDVYARKSSFRSLSGTVNLGNLHGDVTVACKEGNVKIGSIDGSLKADVDRGDVSVYLAQHKDVDIVCRQGDISIKTSSDVHSKFHLQASEKIELSKELTANFTPEVEDGHAKLDTRTKRGASNGGQDSSLTAVTQHGTITLSVQSWLDSLQLEK